MKRQAARGSTLLMALGVTLALALIIGGVLAYTGSEQGRSGRSVRDIDAQACVEAAAQWGRQFYGDRYVKWDDMLSGAMPGYNNPHEREPSQWGEGSYGRIDGRPSGPGGLPVDFRVTIADNIDEFPTPKPGRDNDLQVVLRAECLISRLALPATELTKTRPTSSTDPHNLRGTVLNETSHNRRNKVVEVVLIHIPVNHYKGQRGGGPTGDHNVSLSP
jgi:hypothetical protein